MKLKQFLSVLFTANVQVVLVDLQTNTEIASMKASGYTSLDDTIENREVKQWYIVNATTLKITLGDVIQDETPTPTPEPEEQTEQQTGEQTETPGTDG